LADCEEDLKAMKCGATDYVPLEDITERLFERIIRYSIKSKRLEADLRKRQSELLRKQEKLISQEKKLSILNSSKDKMLSIISHDIRGPVGVISQIADLMLNGELDVASREVFLADIQSQADQTIDLLDNVLYWVKSQQDSLEARLQEVNLNKLLENNIVLFLRNAKFKNIEIRSKLSTSLYVMADREMINLVMRNLLSNAIKFTQPEGHVVIDVTREAGNVNVVVEDSGIGMEQELICQILDNNNYSSSMGTNDEKGSGLGLNLCRDFIQLHGGELLIESEPGKGSKVSFPLKLI
jgi:signal transduction histidine kinase